jgi:arylsulfatase
MDRRSFLTTLGAGAAALTMPRIAFAEPRRPNFILFFTDDQGYNDVGCFGSPKIRTPNFDRMAREGLRLTSFYAQSVCGPSRATLMTGCYPIRVGEPGNTKGQHTILHPKEVTVAEVLKQAGYATGMVGKWHLAGGRRNAYPPELMPRAQGFDSFFGTPLHNGFTREVTARSFKTQLMRDGGILDDFLDQSEMDQLTKRYTEEAVRFIRGHKDEPFFLYLAHNMPHVPLGASEAFRGKSPRGLYGDVIEELDWSMGRILDTLKELGIDEHTLILFTSDNGPWVEKHLGDYGGSADPLRGSKMMTWDGGPRVPCIVRWPGEIPAGRVSSEIVATLDVLPTFASLAGAQPPADRTLDGLDVSAFLTGKTEKSPRTDFAFYCYTHLQAVREGKWKLVLPRPARPRWCGWSARMVDAVETLSLYDLDADIEEKHNVADQHPDVVARLMKLVEAKREELGDYDRIGKGARFFDAGPRRPEIGRQASRPDQGHAKPPAYDKAEPAGNLRFDFEDGMQGWKVVEGDIPHAVSDVQPLYLRGPTNKQGKAALNTLGRAADGIAGDRLTGVLQSPAFVLKGDRMSFLVGGGRSRDTYVALCGADGQELLRANGTNGRALRRVVWDVKAHKGKTLFLRVVDRGTGGWGHVTFDDFSTEGELVP